MKKQLILIPVLTLLISGCSLTPIGSSNGNNNSNQSDNTTSNGENSSIDTSDSVSNPSSEDVSHDPVEPNMKMYSGFTYPSNAQTTATADYYEFWHPNTKIVIDISASQEIFTKMDNAGISDSIYQDLYWPVDVTFTVNGKVHFLEEVGMRRKGNTSRGYSFIQDGAISDAFSFKLSFNELWDEDVYAQFGVKKSWLPTDQDYITRDDRTFLADENNKNGLKKLDIKMYKTQDTSMINQAFAFSLFQKGGLISPNSTLGKINITSGSKTSDFGVVAINEAVDKHLLRRYFSKNDAKGDLYKVGWGPGANGFNKGNLSIEEYNAYPQMIGEENKLIGYSPRYDAKEFDSKKTNPHENLINLMQVLKDNEGKTVSEYLVALEAVVDIDSFLNYAALAYLTGNQDDMRNNGNNYYIYFNPGQNNKAYFIPYDYDWALGLGWNEDGGLNMADLSPFHSKLQGNGRNWQDNRLFLYTIINVMKGHNINTNSAWQQLYYDKIVGHLDSNFYTLAPFNDLFNIYKNNYKNDTNVLKKNSEEVYNNFGGTSVFAEYLNLITNSVENNPLQ